MKLETKLVIFRHYSDKEIDNSVQRLMDEVTAFGNITSNQALWVEQGCNCVYIKRCYGVPSCGGKIDCRKMPDVIRKWLHDVADFAHDNPDDETVFDDCEGCGNRQDCSSKTLRVDIEDFGGDPALRISIIELDGNDIEEILFVMAESEKG